MICDKKCNLKTETGHCVLDTCIYPDNVIETEPCFWCKRLDNGNIIYHYNYKNAIFEAIYDIKYCPVCGKKLKERDG